MSCRIFNINSLGDYCEKRAWLVRALTGQDQAMGKRVIGVLSGTFGQLAFLRPSTLNTDFNLILSSHMKDPRP